MTAIAFNGGSLNPGEMGVVLQDAEGLANLRAPGKNMAWLMEKTEAFQNSPSFEKPPLSKVTDF